MEQRSTEGVRQHKLASDSWRKSEEKSEAPIVPKK
jgi:hypothetical protein